MHHFSIIEMGEGCLDVPFILSKIVAFSQEEVFRGCKRSLNYFQYCEVVKGITTHQKDCKINVIL